MLLYYSYFAKELNTILIIIYFKDNTEVINSFGKMLFHRAYNIIVGET